MNLILASNSTNFGGGYLDHLEPLIREALGEGEKTVAFVPFALKDADGYAAKARERFAQMGYTLRSVHDAADPRALVAGADAVFIGGGNTFRLLKRLYELGLVDAIRERVAAGALYIGTSAGTNVATANIRTTNDMPIVYPPSFDAIGLVPFNINPHYLDADPSSTHMGETREQRLREFFEENASVVAGLREGGVLRRVGDALTLHGNTMRVFFPDGRAEEYGVGSDVSFLLGA